MGSVVFRSQGINIHKSTQTWGQMFWKHQDNLIHFSFKISHSPIAGKNSLNED